METPMGTAARAECHLQRSGNVENKVIVTAPLQAQMQTDSLERD